MKTHEWITISGNVPSKPNCYRIITLNGHGALCKTAALKAYEKSFYLQCGEYRNLGIKGMFYLDVEVYFPSMRSDLDNSLKIILDCLQLCNAIRNDNQCVQILACKFIDKTEPHIKLRLSEVEGD